jgi:hypothetical protein
MTYTAKETTGFPPLLLNKYILGQLELHGLYTPNPNGMGEPIITVQSTNIDDLFDEILPPDGLPFLIVYDRLVRLRPNSFYRNKREQLVYTIHSTDESKMLDISRVIIEALDREDSSGQDINQWLLENKAALGSLNHNVFFHRSKVFQIDETRDLLELGSIKFNYRGKIIIEYDYHTTGSLYT